MHKFSSPGCQWAEGGTAGGADGKYFKLFSLTIKLQLKPETEAEMEMEMETKLVKLQPDRRSFVQCATTATSNKTHAKALWPQNNPSNTYKHIHIYMLVSPILPSLHKTVKNL